jgi:hypothetical protein
MTNVFTRLSTILKVAANEAVCELDAKNDAALLSKESIMEPFKHVLIVLVCCNIV